MKQKIFKSTKFISFVLSALVLVTAIPAGVTASSGTVNETESNNSVSTADTTDDDRDNYGKISYASDVDWWRIDFTTEGFANFWLGNIPTNCDYDLRIYDYTGTKLLVESIQKSNVNELCKIHVRANETYYIKISGCSGTYSSSQYLLRVKRYDLQDAKVFTTTYDTYFNSRKVASLALPELWGMGFGGMEYCDSRVGPAYNVFPTTDIFTLSARGFDAGIYMYESYVLGAAPIGHYAPGSRYLQSYADGALSNVKLALFPGPSSGSSYMGANIVDTVLEKGAFNCITFPYDMSASDAALWTQKFFEYCREGENVGNARKKTNTWAENNISNEHIGNQDVHASREFATLLG